jgi:hypothetical protein
MDVSFDLISYHYYYSWLMFHGGIAQADPEPFMSRYFNPIVELPWYATNALLSPRGSTAAIAAAAGLNLPVVRRIAEGLRANASPTHRLVFGIGAMTLSATGAVFSMELGMSLADVIVSIPMLLAVLMVMRGGKVAAPQRLWPWFVGAGLLSGLAVGAKLTMATYAVALGTSVLAVAGSRRAPRVVAQHALGGVLGVAGSGGWWFLNVWRATGSPVYPYYNGIFHSPLWREGNLRDTRYGPHGLSDAIAYPWYMAEGTTRVLDVPMRDVRWVFLAALVVAAMLVVGLSLAKRGQRRVRRVARPTAELAFWIFFAIGGILWLAQFGIARYAVTTELLTGPAIAICLLVLVRRDLVAAALCVALSGGMAPFNEGKFRHLPFAADRFEVQSKVLQQVPVGAVVIADNAFAPSGFILPSLPRGARRHIIHPWFRGEPIVELLAAQIRDAPSAYVIVDVGWRRQVEDVSALREFFGLVIRDKTCQRVRTGVADRMLCQADFVGLGSVIPVAGGRAAPRITPSTTAVEPIKAGQYTYR